VYRVDYGTKSGLMYSWVLTNYLHSPHSLFTPLWCFKTVCKFYHQNIYNRTKRMQCASRITITCRIQASGVASAEATQAKSCQAGQWRIAHPHLLEIFKYGAPPYNSATRQTFAPTPIAILSLHFSYHANSNFKCRATHNDHNAQISKVRFQNM
jgi:hypothetical protein